MDNEISEALGRCETSPAPTLRGSFVQQVEFLFQRLALYFLKLRDAPFSLKGMEQPVVDDRFRVGKKGEQRGSQVTLVQEHSARFVFITFPSLPNKIVVVVAQVLTSTYGKDRGVATLSNLNTNLHDSYVLASRKLFTISNSFPRSSITLTAIWR